MPKETCEGKRAISTFDLKRAGCFKPPQPKHGLLTWQRGEAAQFRVSTGERRLLLVMQDQDCSVGLDATACFFGGKRWWLICSLGCGRRAAILYLADGRFGCRKCLGLCYASQRMKYVGRAGRFYLSLRIAYSDDKRGFRRSKVWKGRPTRHGMRRVRKKIRLATTFRRLMEREKTIPSNQRGRLIHKV